MANTIPLFLELLQLKGAGAVLRWKDAEKPSRLLNLVTFLEAEGLHTVADLSAWLLIGANPATLQNLRGIGPKTVDYIQQLAGISRVAVDRHLLGFIAATGIRTLAYDEARALIESTASILGVSAIALDRAIWRYQSIQH
jgi:hypothetical protein